MASKSSSEDSSQVRSSNAQRILVKRALLSVSNKRGVVELARGLRALGVHLLSTGGTAATLRENGVEVQDISSHTGFPEIMGGRVKTLHPKIHGGLLARRGIDDEVMAAQGIEAIDLAVVNLYPFTQVVARSTSSLEDAIEHIDIGGPAILRAAAKNHLGTAVVCDPDDYTQLLDELEKQGATLDLTMRRRLALKAFAHTARYDAAIASYLSGRAEFAAATGAEQDLDADALPQRIDIALEQTCALRYGENPHQAAAWYREAGSAPKWQQLAGKELSYNNLADADAAIACARAITEHPACVIVKHANPCGAASAATLVIAYEQAFATDPTSAFGGVIAFNHPLDAQTATRIAEQQFVEVVIAPKITPQAIAAFAAKPNVRLIACGNAEQRRMGFKRFDDGLLLQTADEADIQASELRVVSQRAPTPSELEDLLFSWRIAKFVKSNAIVYAKDQRTLGVGAGQMSRVYSAKIAALKAAEEGLSIEGAAMASDAFFPFRDSIDAASKHGIQSVIQPGGSMRDKEVIAAADEHGLAMVFTGKRHFLH